LTGAPPAREDRCVDEHRDSFKGRYGPTIVAYARHAEVAARVEELDGALAALCERRNAGPGGGRAHFDVAYLLVLARRAG
jgi:hypothetical protein